MKEVESLMMIGIFNVVQYELYHWKFKNREEAHIDIKVSLRIIVKVHLAFSILYIVGSQSLSYFIDK